MIGLLINLLIVVSLTSSGKYFINVQDEKKLKHAIGGSCNKVYKDERYEFELPLKVNCIGTKIYPCNW